jgi:predicted O-methyltransferase YrrM
MSEGNGSPVPRRVLLGMPGYGEMTAGASRGLWRASKGRDAKVPIDEISVSYHQGSLLAQNFNALWCEALSECHRGRPVHYFAMLHADIEPEDGWLDILIAELEARQLDVLSAVVPIKDPIGLTSTALERDDKDPWRVLCRLTMKEVYRLPETFMSEDVGHPLLLNTGCWVCRFDPAWAKKVRFTINDRIVFNTKTGVYQAQVEPEDWYFSRLCYELGLKLAATRKVRLNHIGKGRYVNHEPWGQNDFDADYVPASVVPPAESADGFTFPEDVEGWLLPSEGRALADLARGKRVLEVGSYCGRSTICLAQTADAVVSVDPHDGRATPRPKSTYDTLKDNLDRYGLRNVKALVGTLSDGTAEFLSDFDLVFIDGAHDLESVRSDIRRALPLLSPGGLLAFHDYRTRPGQHDGRWDEGVTRAVDELIAEGGELLSTHGTVAVVKPPPLLETAHAPHCNVSAR